MILISPILHKFFQKLKKREYSFYEASITLLPKTNILQEMKTTDEY